MGWIQGGGGGIIMLQTGFIVIIMLSTINSPNTFYKHLVVFQMFVLSRKRIESVLDEKRKTCFFLILNCSLLKFLREAGKKKVFLEPFFRFQTFKNFNGHYARGGEGARP